MSIETQTTHTGLVYKKSTGIYWVNAGDQSVTCSISSRLRKVLIYPTAALSSNPHRRVQSVEDIRTVDPVAIGDTVNFIEAGDGSGVIIDVQPRHSQLTRRAPGPKPLEQIVVANVDQIVPVVAAAQPKPRWGMVDRYLIGAESCGLPAVICITKMDALKGRHAQELDAVIDDYRRIGYPVILTSSVDGSGMDEVRQALVGRISVFVGMSGVGKTSLLNRVQPGLGLKVSAINLMLDKGRHTTTGLEMFPLEAGGHIVDTPGMKTFGFWDLDSEDIANFFREMQPYVGQCRFGLSCRHDTEPGCAIKAAVEDGSISQRRYQSYGFIRDHIQAEEK
ncbi:MAG: ribosome small subunit-dependent GTPase A [Anaerolineae bacterium]|nr:ribosome small subunit-dependent GTPase A [Anaerolineae bacterium]